MRKKEMEDFLKALEKPTSNLKIRPKNLGVIPEEYLERLNALVAKKLEQNKQERIASMLDAKGKNVV